MPTSKTKPTAELQPKPTPSENSAEPPFLGLGRYEWDNLCIFASILKMDEGCTTPAEHFIRSLVARHSHHPLTPDDVVAQLEEFKLDFYDAIAVTKLFQKQYPDLTKPEATNAK